MKKYFFLILLVIVLVAGIKLNSVEAYPWFQPEMVISQNRLRSGFEINEKNRLNPVVLTNKFGTYFRAENLYNSGIVIEVYKAVKSWEDASYDFSENENVATFIDTVTCGTDCLFLSEGEYIFKITSNGDVIGKDMYLVFGPRTKP